MREAARPISLRESDEEYLLPNTPILSREEQIKLVKRWRKRCDRPSRDRLVEHNIRLVMDIASRYRLSGVSMVELIQEGNIGLLEAANRFKPAKRVSFPSYAQFWVRAYISRYIMRNRRIGPRTITTPHRTRVYHRLGKEWIKLQNKLNREPTREELAQALGVSVEDIEAVTTVDLSLSRPLSQEEGEVGTVEDLLASEAPTPDEVVAICEWEAQIGTVRWKVEQCLRDSPRELSIIKGRLLRNPPLTLAAIGKKFGVSRERVRQLQMRAIRKLQNSEALKDLFMRRLER